MILKSSYIAEETVNGACGLGKGEGCCRYLGLGQGGWRCLKHSEMRAVIDRKFAEGSMTAKGDNCEGFPRRDA